MSTTGFFFPHFADPDRSERVANTVHTMFLASGAMYGVEEFSAALRASLERSPDPDLAVTNLARFVEASLNATALFNDLVKHRVLMDVLVTILSSSQYFADILVRDPELFRWLTASDALVRARQKDFLATECARVLRMFQKPERRLDALKRLYRREILRIGARDILGEADLPTLTKELAHLADAIVDACCVVAHQQLVTRFPSPPETPYAVIGLGKFGGEELNYSSDIDIIFVYKEEGELTDAAGRHRTYHEYFNAFAEKLVQNLSQTTAEGHLYRVDTRLRPESGAGPLARSMQSYLLYYESRGELWERQMLIKARAVAGDVAFGEEFLQHLVPFVYPRTFMENPRQYIARIKSRIEAAIAGEENVKLRAGGIRDIEFIVQALQLIHGGKDNRIRSRTSLHALRQLEEAGLLTGDEARTLREAYIFFRAIEHRLQTMMNTQTHEMPNDPRALHVLARKVGLPDRRALQSANAHHLAAVRRIFHAVLATESGVQGHTLETILDGNPGADAVASVLSAYGFKDVRKAVKNFGVMLSGSGLMTMRELDSRARDAFRAVASDLMKEIAATPVCDMTLHNLALLSAAHPFPEQFYRQIQQPAFRRLVLKICSTSSRFAKGISRLPIVLEMIAADPSGEEVTDVGESLREQKTRHELLAGIRYVLGIFDLRRLTRELSATANRVAERALRNVCDEARIKRPLLGVFALGKFGTEELTFDADLDLVLVAEAGSDRAKPKLEKLGMAFVQKLSDGAAGKVYDVDVRLRPEGRNAPLVVDRHAYLHYLAKRASLWERQSLTRLRFVAGNEALGRRVVNDVREFVYQAPLPHDWVTRIIEMRRKTETRSRAGANLLDFKLGPGGMVDIEFLAQMIQLRYGGTQPDLSHGDTATVLSMAPVHIADASTFDALIKAYGFYRTLETQMRITLEEQGTILPMGEKLDLLAVCLDGSQGTILQRHVSDTMRNVREAFLAISQQLSH